jgi:hypothetical protein
MVCGSNGDYQKWKKAQSREGRKIGRIRYEHVESLCRQVQDMKRLPLDKLFIHIEKIIMQSDKVKMAGRPPG